jgi:hypothetical protein
MSCVFIVLKYVLEVVACTAPRFWHRKCRYPRIRGFMPIPQVPQFPMYGFICIFIGPKYIPTYHPHTSNPQGPSQPRMYTPNPQCPLSAKCDRGSQRCIGGCKASALLRLPCAKLGHGVTDENHLVSVIPHLLCKIVVRPSAQRAVLVLCTRFGILQHRHALVAQLIKHAVGRRTPT